MQHSIPENVLNSHIVYCIDEYVRYERDRQILKDHWFRNRSFDELCGIYHLSLTAVKKIIYTQGDKILLRAEDMGKK